MSPGAGINSRNRLSIKRKEGVSKYTLLESDVIKIRVLSSIITEGLSATLVMNCLWVIGKKMWDSLQL